MDLLFGFGKPFFSFMADFDHLRIPFGCLARAFALVEFGEHFRDSMDGYIMVSMQYIVI